MKPLRTGFSNDSIRSVLIVNLGGFGDLLLATPFFREARRMFPLAKMTLLCVASSAPVLEGNPWLDSVVALPGLKPRNMPAALPVLWPVRRPELLINMLPIAGWKGALKFRLLHTLLAPEHSVGLDTAGRGRFFSIPVYEEEWGQWGAVDNYLKLLGRLGGRTDIRHPELFLGKTTDSPLPEHSGRWVGIHPGASIPARRWSTNRYAEAIRQLAQDYPDLQFVVTGTVEEVEISQALIRQSALPKERIHNYCGKTALTGLTAILRQLSLYLTNDTGTMHLAAALGIPMVVLWGPGNVYHTSPIANPHLIRLLRVDIDCAPCTFTHCSHQTCLERISVEQVLDASRNLLDGGEKRG